MIRRVGEKETGTPLLNSISKMSLFRLFSSCLPIHQYQEVVTNYFKSKWPKDIIKVYSRNRLLEATIPMIPVTVIGS